jgi:tRNA(Ile)-lysidine synthase
MEKISNPITLHNGPAIIRPFLDIPKERLKATLKEKVQQWIEDPSNENLGFLRIQVRKLLETTEIDGLNRDRLTSTAKRMQSVNKVLEGQVQKFLKENVIIFDEGYASLDPIPFRSLFEETGHKVLSILLQKMGGGKYPPRFEKIERLHKDLIQDDFIGATLAGCQIWAEGERLFFCRECNHIDDVKDIRAGSEILWDNRFVLNIKNVDQELVIKKLGQEGWQYCLDHLEGARNIDLPHSVRLSLPAFYNGEILIDVPHLKLTNSESNDVKMTLK